MSIQQAAKLFIFNSTIQKIICVAQGESQECSSILFLSLSFIFIFQLVLVIIKVDFCWVHKKIGFHQYM